MLDRGCPSPEKRGEVIKCSTLRIIYYQLYIQGLTIANRELSEREKEREREREREREKTCTHNHVLR